MADASTHRKEDVESNEPVGIPLGLGWVLAVTPCARGALVRISRGREEEALDVQIHMTAQGPVVRTHAARLELESTDDIVARCDRFRIEARESVELTSQGTIVQKAKGNLRSEGRAVTMEAMRGDIRLKANDDVQLLGEQVLLNCDRQPPVPSWVPVAPIPQTTVARTDVSGDPDLFEELPPQDPEGK
jgi:hypothetical protein